VTPLQVLWGAFFVIVGGLLALDLGVVNRHAHVITLRQAASWTAVWVGAAFLYCLAVWWGLGGEKAVEFLTAYLVEESLSVDNLFVFIMIFSYFKIPPERQGRVLKWGILGAVVFRLIFILLGVAMIRRFHWVLYVFGAILILTAVKMLFHKEGAELDPSKNLALRALRAFMRVDATHQGEEFFVGHKGSLHATTMFATLLVVESSDIAFAVDSIPAVFGITQDVFIIYTSNIFAILGLRTLYFLLAGILDLFAYLKYGISFVLLFIGIKLVGLVHPSVGASLAVVGSLLGLSVLASLVFPPREENGEDPAE